MSSSTRFGDVGWRCERNVRSIATLIEYLPQKMIDRWRELMSPSDGDDAILDEYHRDGVASLDFQQDVFVGQITSCEDKT